MDRITATLLKEFVATQGLESSPESEQFEHFANYSVLFAELSDTFELDDVAVGQGGNLGIDGLAVIVNGAHVLTEEDADSLIDANGFLDVDFVFIQAKTSAGFDLGEISKVFFAVADFFSEEPKLSHTPATKDLMRLKDHIYSRSGDMANRTPNVSIFYVCTGKWTDDAALQARIDTGKTELMQTQLFYEVAFTPVDASRLQNLYRVTKGKSSAKFSFSARVALPQQVNAVSEAHFGVIPAKEFLKLILDDNGNIKKSLFYDNVRDFQDFNKVNKDIRATLQASSDRSLFPLLNNGITIIAGTVRPTGNIFHIEDYQIVNGCQTSHVLYHERANITDDVYVPIKIISTSDDDVVNRIIKATNFQTEVKPDQLYALSDFQKKLEEYYATYEGEQRLYYERRSKQYATAPKVEKVRIVTIQQQIRAFVAMFLQEPHRGHYPRSMGPNVGKTLFGRDHLPDPYYLSAYAQFRLEYFFRNGSLDKKYKPARYHLLMGAQHVLNPQSVPSPAANEMKRFCAKLLPGIHDDKKLLAAFQKAAAMVDLACGKHSLDRKLTKTQPFSKRFQQALVAKFPMSAKKK
jgi:hypothetical protein